jgi:hypothetical protein
MSWTGCSRIESPKCDDSLKKQKEFPGLESTSTKLLTCARF